jgi:hypothetical protein
MSENTSTALTVHKENLNVPSIFNDLGAFEQAQRMARLLSSTELVPPMYKETGNGKGLASCLIALDLAQRVGTSPLLVMQNLDIIHGKPAWNSKFIIAVIKSCGRFSDIDFIIDGAGDDLGCYLLCKNAKTSQVLRGQRISIGMAKKEGWYSRSGSKWASMPEQMLQYRAASFFSRIHCPDLLNGMHSAEEVEDVQIIEATPSAADKINNTVEVKGDAAPKRRTRGSGATAVILNDENSPATEDAGPGPNLEEVV